MAQSSSAEQLQTRCGSPDAYIVLGLAVYGVSSRALAGVELLGDQKTAFLDRVVAEHAKVASLWIKVDWSQSEAPKRWHHTYEWATSSDGKIYTKRHKLMPVGQPESESYGIGVYDGRNTYLYGSSPSNGSVRAGFDLQKEQRLAYLFPGYGNHFGNINGRIATLFKPLKAEDWRAELSDNGRELTLIMLKGLRQSWTFDLSKGAVTKEVTTDVSTAEGGLRRVLTLTVKEVKEIAPGIWLPMDSEILIRDKIDGQWQTYRSRHLVREVKVNKPEIEKCFSFEWPKGTQYYDYNLGMAVHPEMAQAELERRLEELARELPTTPNDHAMNAPTSMAPADDIAVADTLARGDHSTGQASKMPGAQQIWLVLALAFAAVIIGAGYVRWLRRKRLGKKRREGADGTGA